MVATPKHKAAIAALVIEREGRMLNHYECRELERIIHSRSVNHERFIQKVRAPEYHWIKPEPRRR